MEIGLVLAFSFLGISVLAFIMIITIRMAYWKIQKQKIDLSEYFFNVPRRPEKPDNWSAIEKSLIYIGTAFIVLECLLMA